MSGFVCIVTNEEICPDLQIEYESLNPVEFRKKTGPDYGVYQFANRRFPDDKVFAENEDLLVVLDGFVLNFRSLQSQQGSADYFQTIKALYQSRGKSLVKDLRGEFSGILYDKKKQTWLLFTGPTGTKPLFYFANATTFVCGSELPVVAQVLQKLGQSITLDVIGSYFLLTYGYMLEDYTLITEVKRVKPGHTLTREGSQTHCHQYHAFQNEETISDSREDILTNLDSLFTEAVTLEYEKDREYGYQHLATLSGGLESRMNVCTAWELGYQPIVNLTFSQSNYLDEKIAKQISADTGMNFLFYALDHGNYLRHTLAEAVRINGGLALYSGAAHALSFYKLLNFGSFGMLHTGQLGGGTLGSYLTKPFQEKPQCSSGSYSTYLFSKISETIEKILARYDSEEIFTLYNRGFNGIVNGNWMAQTFTEVASPFLYLDFFEYALRIPPSLRFHHDIYLEWIRKKHPLVARYPWEKTGKKITASTTSITWKKRLKAYKQILSYKLFGTNSPHSMNPFEYWYATNYQLVQYMQDTFQQLIDQLDDNSELQQDVKTLFEQGTLTEKTQVLTLLEAVKLYF
jgi:asparagine synthase (glutamine-hydrolysing)